MKIDSNENKNKPDVSEKRLKELGILKILHIIIAENEEPQYKCITEEGKVVTIKASELLEK